MDLENLLNRVNPKELEAYLNTEYPIDHRGWHYKILSWCYVSKAFVLGFINYPPDWYTRLGEKTHFNILSVDGKIFTSTRRSSIYLGHDTAPLHARIPSRSITFKKKG